MKTTSKKPKKDNQRLNLVSAVKAPLGFFVLSLLIVEAMLGVVLVTSNLAEAHVWIGFQVMIGVFILVIIIVALMAVFFPTNLVYGKEEHSAALDPSALRDSIDDAIASMVKPDCLQRTPK